MNVSILLGRLCRDPELRYLPSGQPVVNFSIAVEESYKNRDGEKVERTLWVNIVAFAKTAELVSKYLHKGDQALINGRLQCREYEAKDGGGKRRAWEVVANQVKFLGGRRTAEQGSLSDTGERGPEPPADDEDIPF